MIAYGTEGLERRSADLVSIPAPMTWNGLMICKTAHYVAKALGTFELELQVRSCVEHTVITIDYGGTLMSNISFNREQFPMPETEHSIPFWSDGAARKIPCGPSFEFYHYGELIVSESDTTTGSILRLVLRLRGAHPFGFVLSPPMGRIGGVTMWEDFDDDVHLSYDSALFKADLSPSGHNEEHREFGWTYRSKRAEK